MAGYFKTPGLCTLAVAWGALCGSSEGRAQIGGVPIWTNTYHDASTYALATDHGGNVLVAGWSGGDFLTLKYAGTGALLWARAFNGPAGGDDRAHGVAVDGDGNAYVTGESPGGGCATIKYSPAGEGLWTNYLNATRTDAISVDAHGKVFVGGGDGNYVTVAYSDGGMPLWTNRYGPTVAPDGVWKLMVDANGDVVAGGYSGAVKYTASGVPVWTNAVMAYNVAADASGNVVIGGSVIAKYSPSGAQLWAKPIPSDNPGFVALDSSGNVYATGATSRQVSGSMDLMTVKYSSSGEPMWTNYYDGALNLDDWPNSIAVDGNDNVFVFANSVEDWGNGESFFRAWTMTAYSSNGVPLWTQPYESVNEGWTGASSAGQSGVDANGNMVVVGTSFLPPGGEGSVVIKYSSAILPQMAISHGEGESVEVSWPSPSLGFVLQENTDPSGSWDWSDVSGTPQDDGWRVRFQLSPTAGNRSYRLLHH